MSQLRRQNALIISPERKPRTAPMLPPAPRKPNRRVEQVRQQETHRISRALLPEFNASEAPDGSQKA